MRIGQDKSAATACIGKLSGDLEPLNSKLDTGNFETASLPVPKPSVTINFLSDSLSRTDEKQPIFGHTGGISWRKHLAGELEFAAMKISHWIS
jgi:hypothetical protein